MKLAAISNDRRELDVPFGDEPDAPIVHIVYDPLAYTTAFEEELQEISTREFQSIAVVKATVVLIKDWDLEDDNGKIELTEARLKHVPIGVLNRIFTEIRNSSKPSSEEGKDSGAGSSPGETLEHSLSGTR